MERLLAHGPLDALRPSEAEAPWGVPGELVQSRLRVYKTTSVAPSRGVPVRGPHPTVLAFEGVTSRLGRRC